MRINILPPSVFNLLAAGEVVENPAAIVKECVENSIDAGATKIEISIERGGFDNITISDNGCGVAEDDVEKVFYPHATSKISNAKDLGNIGTLGFRGEAMSSIAAVSFVNFKTSTGENKGTHLRIAGGQVEFKKLIARQVGTTVSVSNLFYNTPARLKFLRSAGIEKNAVTLTVQRIILSNPSIAVRYIVDGEIIIDYKGLFLKDAIKAVYNEIKNEDFLEVNKVSSEFSLIGFVGNTGLTKRNKSFQTVIVNSRPVDGGIISDAVNNVFSNFMITGNFPFFVLDFKTNLSDVDVNIHPRKAQVKFSKNNEIQEFVTSAINDCIDKYLHEKHSVSFKKSDDDEILKRISMFQDTKIDDTQKVKSADFIMNMYDLRENPKIEKEPEQQAIETKSVDKFKIFGAVFNSYILMENEKGFHMIDQHAAHERLLYDKLSNQIDNGHVEVQRLISPEVLSLSTNEMTKMEDAMETLNKCGVECEPFGTNCVRITAVPVIVANHGVGMMLDNLLSSVKSVKVSDLLKETVIKQCCRGAIKAGQTLSDDEIKKLVNDVFEGHVISSCPHGRPIIVSYTQSQLEKLFSRK